MPELREKTIAVLGLAFKPDTDDMRESPALTVIDRLKSEGAVIRVFDPIAMEECKRRLGDSVFYCTNFYHACESADAMLLMTEWRQFRSISWEKVRSVMRGTIVVDGRNIYNRKEVENLGFTYTTIGEQ